MLSFEGKEGKGRVRWYVLFCCFPSILDRKPSPNPYTAGFSLSVTRVLHCCAAFSTPFRSETMVRYVLHHGRGLGL